MNGFSREGARIRSNQDQLDAHPQAICLQVKQAVELIRLCSQAWV
jgi:hypothetical protein